MKSSSHTHKKSLSLAAVLRNRHGYSLLMHTVPKFIFINLKCKNANIGMCLRAVPFSVFDIVKRNINRLDIFLQKTYSKIQFTFLALQEPLLLKRSSNDF